MEQNETQKQVISGLFWKVMENGGSQGIQFAVSIILARLLSPSEYRTIALIMIFITIANVLVQSGFATALIQKKEADNTDFSSVLYLSLMVSAAAYWIIYLFAPAIADFYHQEELNPILRIMGLVVFPGVVISVQNAVVAKKMAFKKLFFATLIATVLSGAAGILSALRGMGVWALVMQQMVYYVILMLMLFWLLDFRPAFVFAAYRLRALFSFGWKVLAAALLDTVFSNLQALVMGKIYSDDTLGNFNRGEQFPKLIVLNISSAIQSVLLPVAANVQESKEGVRELLKSSVRMSAYLVLPMMAGLFGVGDQLIFLLLGQKWMGAVIFLRLMCISYAFWPMHIANLQAINALGRSDIFLYLEIVKKVLSLGILLLGMRYGAVALVALKAFSDFLCSLINAYPNRNLVGYSIGEQWKDVLPSSALSVIMGTAVYFVGSKGGYGVHILLLQILIGISVYLILSVVTKNENFMILLGLLRKSGAKKNEQ